MDDFDSRYWKLYREERLKLAKSSNPNVKKPFQVALTPQQIVHVARSARQRHTKEKTRGTKP